MVLYMPKNKKWHELTAIQKTGIIGMAVVQIALLIAALVDVRRRPAEQINGSKRLWTGLAFINFVGPIAYFTIGRKH